MRAREKELVLFTPYFAARTPQRQAELDYCLARNIECSEIERIVLLVDDGHRPPCDDPKVQILPLDSRPTYKHWVTLSQAMVPDGISVLANTDIYFDSSIRGIRTIFKQPQGFVALSRHEKLGGEIMPHPNPAWSQDVWGFHTRSVIAPSLLEALNVPLGVPRCDNKIAYLFGVHGWRVFNPHRHVFSVHVHETQQRNYDKKTDLTVIGAVAYVHPSESLNVPSKLDIDVWAMNAGAINSVKVNRSLDLWAAETTAVRLAGASEAGNEVPADPMRSGETAAVGSKSPAKAAAADRYRFVKQGQRVFDYVRRFSAYRLGNSVLALDWLNPESSRLLCVGSADAANEALATETLLALFIPPILDTSPIAVRERPQDPEDCQFWQYPCSTEKQAYDNHQSIAFGGNVDPLTRTVNTYLGLPWATYIDKKVFPAEMIARLAARVSGLIRFVESQGYRLAVHTVCQQIYWRRLIEQFHALHVTDLHISHAERHLDPAAEGWKLRIHSWPLIAPNVEDPTRRAGLVVGKPIERKRYLASFIGAHMPHYRSDVRVRLLDAARASGRNDVLVDLGNEWHFNKVVYAEQVNNETLSKTDAEAQDASTRRYNSVISDSVFSLCPEGAGPNTLRVWESLAVGAIPVIFAPGWVPPPVAEGHPDMTECAVFVDDAPSPALFERLAAMPRAEVARMQRNGMALYELIRRRTAFP